MNKILIINISYLTILKNRGSELPAEYGEEYFYGVGSGYRRGYVWETIGHLSRSHFKDVTLHSRYKSGRWLDAGWAKGFLLKIANQHGWEPFGFEASPYAVEEARKICPNAQIFVSDAQDQLPFPNNFFEVITACELVEHLPEPNKFFKEAWRLLKHDGLLFITTPNASSIFSSDQAKNLCRVVKVDTPFHDETHVSYFTSETIERLLKRCGFSRVETKYSLDLLWRWSVHMPSSIAWTMLAFAYRSR